MYCSECGAKIKENAKFCDECGAPAENVKYCSGCGAEQKENARFCDVCGTPAGDSSTPPPVETPPYAAPVESPYAPPPVETPPYAVPVESPPKPPPVETPTYAAPESEYVPPQVEMPDYGAPAAESEYTPPAVEMPDYGGAQADSWNATQPSFDGEQATQPYTPSPEFQPSYSSPQTPPQKPGGTKLNMKIVIPAAILAVLLLVFSSLYLFTDILPFGSSTTTVSPSPDDEVSPSPDVSARNLPSSGGEVRVREETEFTFSPNESGIWEFRTMDNDGCDPYLELRSSQGALIAEDDDGGGYPEALIRAELNAAETYTIIARYADGADKGSYTLSVTPAGSQQIDGYGQEVFVIGETEYSFIPELSGFWEFTTMDNGSSDPYIAILFKDGGVYAVDDDGADNNNNAYLVVYLEAGTEYIINARFHGDDSGSYTLRVEYAMTTPIPGSGGDVGVYGKTLFTFMPEESGVWDIFTSNNEDSDPILMLYGHDGELIDVDDDGMGDYNALISAHLDAGVMYLIRGGFYDDGGGICTLTVRKQGALPADGVEIPGNGGTVTVSSPTLYLFTPNHSGVWQLFTSENVDCDPHLTVLVNNTGELLDYDDDSLGDLNAVIYIELDEGVTYAIDAGFGMNESGSYKLTVVPILSIPESGGSVRIDGTTAVMFTPAHTGTWVIVTTDIEDSQTKPMLVVLNLENEFLGEGVSMDDNNVYLAIELLAGEEYIIATGPVEGSGRFDLNVFTV